MIGETLIPFIIKTFKGQRVRIFLRAGNYRFEGICNEVSDEHIVLVDDTGSTKLFAIADIVQLEDVK